MTPHSHWATKRPIPFVNVSGAAIPAFAVMAVRGVAYEQGIAFLQCDQPSAAFVRQYAVNNIYDVPAGLRGTCFRGGDVRVLYDAGTPAAGEGWGPKPGQWAVAQGFPTTTTVGGIVSATARILLGSLREIDRVLVKTTATVASGATTTSYAIYAGALGAETTAAFTTVPPARNRGETIESDAWALLLWVNSGWELREVERGEEVDRVWWAVANANLDPFESGDVMLSTLENVTATNWSDTARIGIGQAIFAWKDPSDELYYCIGGRQPRWFKGTLNGTLFYTDATASVVATAALDGGAVPGGALTAGNGLANAGQNGAACLFAEHIGTGYELARVQNVQHNPVNTVEWNTPKLQRKHKAIIANYGGSESAPIDILTAAAVELVQVVDYTKPTLSYTTRNVLTFEDTVGNTETVLTTVDVVVDRDVFVAGLNLYQYTGAVTVFEAAVASPSLIALGALCLEIAGGAIESYTYPAAFYDPSPAAFAADGTAMMSPAFF